jgi:hypothetical protein
LPLDLFPDVVRAPLIAQLLVEGNLQDSFRSPGRVPALAGFPLVRLDVSPTAVFPLIITKELDDIFSRHALIVPRAKVAELGLDSILAVKP